MTNGTPPMAYADVIFRHKSKPPKETLTQEQINAVPDLKDDIEKDIEDDRQPTKYDDNEIEIIRQKISESSHIIGLRPISIQQINEEAEKIKKNKKIKETDRIKIIAIATKTIVMKFFRDKLKMDDDTRENLEITKIFPSKNPEARIMYVECSSTDEISKITSLAKNIEFSNLKEEAASIATHIPKILYARYLSIEKLMYQLRMSSKGNIQTNVRLGKNDFIIRQKLKNDRRKWKDVTPLEIPPHIAKIDLDIIKNQDKNQENEDDKKEELYNSKNETQEMEDDDTNKNMNEDDEQEQDEDDQTLDNFLTKAIQEITKEDDDKPLSGTNGSVSKQLQNNKHKLSPNTRNNTETTQKPKKVIKPDEYNQQMDELTDEIDIEVAKANEILRTPSMDKIINKIPSNINITKVNTKSTTEQSLRKQS